MAHELSIRANGQVEMGYVGAKPWHGLGNELEAGASIETWTKAAGLDWEVKESPIEFMVDGVRTSFDNRKALYRSDSKMPLSVVSNSYKTVQPAVILDFFREVTEKTDAQMETAGALFGGKVIWALARLGNDAKVRDDLVAPYLMLTTSFDRSLPTIAKLTAVRVVCNNTLQLSMKDTNTKQIRIPHSTNFVTAEVRAGLNVSLDQFDKFMQKANGLAAQSFSMSDMDQFLVELLKPNAITVEAENVRKSAAYKKITDLFNGGQLGNGQDAINNTAWGALNAVTEFIDHMQGKNQSARLMNAWFGLGGKLKDRALDLLVA